jgi:hypothetical protein
MARCLVAGCRAIFSFTANRQELTRLATRMELIQNTEIQRPGNFFLSPLTFHSLEELQAVEDADEVSITQPGIVVNMPILVWPGGSR